MSLPRNIRLLTSIALVSLLTSLFLLIQMCLLDASCYNGLSVMAAHHRRLLTLYGRDEKMNERLNSVESSDIVIEQNITRRDTLSYQVTSFPNRSTMSEGKIVSVGHSTVTLDGGNTTGSVKYTTDYHSNDNHSGSSLPVWLNTSRTASTTTRSPLSTISITIQHQLSTATHDLAVPSQYPTPEGRQSELLPSSSSKPQVHFIQIPKPAASMLQFSNLGPTTYCKLPHCMDYFSYLDKLCHDYCLKKQRIHLPSHSRGMYGDCRFMNGNRRAAVALASLPGSGNTWIRGLLEKATGICTGAVYCDVYLKEAGFNGEGLRSGSVLVVKTHKANITWTDLDRPEHDERGTPSYGAVVLLIRNPYHAMVAEWNREAVRAMRKLANATTPQPQDTIHTGSVGPEHFGDNPAWSAFIYRKMRKWQSYVDNIILGAQGQPRLVVHYEDFQRDRVKAVARILDFLYFPYVEKTLHERLQDDFEVFHRQSHPSFEHFTNVQIEMIQRALMGLLERLRERNNGITYGIEEYLR